MDSRPLEVALRDHPSVSIIDLRGEITASAEQALEEAYSAADATANPTILLNFTDVRYINSTGIAIIVSLLARAGKGRKRLLACGLSQNYMEILRITRLADFMYMLPDEQSALTADLDALVLKRLVP